MTRHDPIDSGGTKSRTTRTHDPHRLRIQHVIGSFQVGGAERYALQLARRQARSGHDVHVLGLAHGPLIASSSTTGSAFKPS